MAGNKKKEKAPRRPTFDLCSSEEDDEPTACGGASSNVPPATAPPPARPDPSPDEDSVTRGLDPKTDSVDHNDYEMDEDLKDLPLKIRERLMPFQAEGVRFGLRREGRLLIADEMG